MNLDKLRKLIEAYNPASSRRTAESMDAHHELALLAHYLLLPMAEALEGVGCQDAYEPGGTAREDVEKHCCGGTGNRRCTRCAVLASLEEALK